MDIAELSGDRQRVAPDVWLDVMAREYLADYVKSGGSAVKVVSGAQEALSDVSCRLQEMAQREGYFTADLDAARLDAAGKKPDAHRIDRFFFAVTREVDWRKWAAAQARDYLEGRGIVLSPERSLGDLEGIAADNGRDSRDLLNQFEREFSTPQIKDRAMAYEFRTAVTALGRAQFIPDAVTPTTEEILLGWFSGRSMPGGSTALKKLQIFERINLGNARLMLSSFCRWLPRTGYNGLVVTLDFRPYEHKKLTAPQRQKEHMQKLYAAIERGASQEELLRIKEEGSAEPPVTYGDAAYMQMLTLIRHFIDEVDRFERFLLVILTSPGFYDPTSRRNYTDYNALQTRIGLEVHDARRANPAAALVHLGGTE